MRILLDEGVPDVIQARLSGFAISSAKQMGWRGVKNGDPLDLMVGSFDVLITTEKSLPFQQNLRKRNIAVIILPTNEVPYVIKLLRQVELTLKTISPGQFIQLKRP